MGIAGFDHVAITVQDVDLTIDWYSRVLEAIPLHHDLWVTRQIPVGLLQLGACRMSLHQIDSPAAPHAHVPTPGSADLCFRWDGPVAEILDQLRLQGVDVALGPVSRPASSGERGTSVYIRDPDNNLLELLTVTPD